MDRRENRRLRLIQLLGKYETLTDASRESGISAAYLSTLKNPARYDRDSGKHARSISDKTAERIERKFGKPAGWLDIPVDRVADAGSDYSVEPMPSYRGDLKWVPEISWIQAGSFVESHDNFAKGDGEKWHGTTLPIGKGTYVLRIKGDSMLAPLGTVPTYPEGFIIIVDPTIEPAHGADCVFKKPDSMEATFKRLIVDGSQYFLKPLNPAYPVIEIDESYEYCGTCIHVGMDIVK